MKPELVEIQIALYIFIHLSCKLTFQYNGVSNITIDTGPGTINLIQDSSVSVNVAT